MSSSTLRRPVRPFQPFHPVFAALLLAAAVLAGCGPSQPPAAGGPGAGGPPPAMPVGVRVVSQQTVPVLIDAVGQAEGSKEVEVHARVSGLIQRQIYREGERVAVGAPLFTIERAPFENALNQARAVLAQEQARVEQARREAQRLKPLAEAQAISQREADDSASNLRLTEASVVLAQSRVKDAELNLSYTAVVAPIAGISGRAERSEGSLVTPGADSLLTKVLQADPIWVRFAFSEAEQAQLRRGKAGAVRMLSSDGKPMAASGRLNFSGSTVDARLGTVQMRAAFANPELLILPGQFVRAQVVAGEERAFLVPQAAVVSNELGKAVWTIKDGKATPTPVEVGGWVGSDWAVRKGLNEGDQVIVDNLIKLRPGAAVMVRPPTASGSASGAAPGGASGAAPASTASR
jgi:membrane fusion protein (multidrug efflux system)